MSILKAFDLTGKVSVVTGGGSGLGRMMAIGLAEAGSDIVICSRKLEKCEATADEIEKLGVKTLATQCDLNCDEDLDQLVRNTIKKFGRINVLVNNSGLTWAGPPEDIKMENWKKVIDVNITGTFRCTQKVGREMIRQKSGKIINISSAAGLGGTDPKYLDSLPYNTSKGALIVFTKDLAVKWAKYNINVNCIAPGWFYTKMTKLVLEHEADILRSRLLIKRFGVEHDIKGAVIFLASNASDYMTGQIMNVDGGLSAWAS